MLSFQLVRINTTTTFRQRTNFKHSIRWLFYDDVDPYGQLQWLVQVLVEAEKNNEKVHILSHIPNGDGTCLFNWNREYIKIINRFASIIAAQFNGHTHYDETIIFFNTSNPAHAINVAFNGGSLTAYSHLNPNYKVFEVDSSTLVYKPFIINLSFFIIKQNFRKYLITNHGRSM